MPTVSIFHIVVTIGDKQLSLTPDEARDLRDALDTVLAPDDKTPQVVERIVEHGHYYPCPTMPYRPSPWWSVQVGDTPINWTATPDRIGTVNITSSSENTAKWSA